jgi:ketosteroid isomerase-like protein
LDLPDRDVFASVWTEDAVYRVDDPFGEVRGVQAIVAAWDTFQTIFIDMHHHTMNVIVDGPHGDLASSVSFALVTGTDAEGTAWTASCIYYDKFRKVDEEWLLTERYDKVNYMVPWLAPLGLDESKRVYVNPDVIQRLIAAGQARQSAVVS